MDQEELKKELNELHLQLTEELGQSDKLDPETLASLRQVVSDIQKLVQAQNAESDPTEWDSGSLEAMAVGFEVEHPQLAALLNRFNYLLGNMGI